MLPLLGKGCALNTSVRSVKHAVVSLGFPWKGTRTLRQGP
jgi:hypothetical protein